MPNSFYVDALDHACRNVDWAFDTAFEAEEFARSLCAKGYNAITVGDGNPDHPRILACVNMDNDGRVWTDVTQMEGTLL